MLGHPILENQTDYSIYSGKPARQIIDVSEWTTSKIDGVDFHLCHQEKSLTLQPYQQIQDMEYFQSQGLMQRKCLPTKSYQYQLTTLSSLNPYKMVWIDRRQNLHIEYLLRNLQEGNLTLTKTQKISRDWILRLTGRIQVTTPMMEKN